MGDIYLSKPFVDVQRTANMLVSRFGTARWGKQLGLFREALAEHGIDT